METTVQEISSTSTLLMLEYKSTPKDTYYTLTICINDKGEYCDIIVHELKRTLCGKNISSHNAHKKIQNILLTQKINYKIVEKESPAL